MKVKVKAMKVNLSDQDERERSWESCKKIVLKIENFMTRTKHGNSVKESFLWGPNKMRRKPASSVKERVSEEVLVGFEAENLRCRRPHDTWGGQHYQNCPGFTIMIINLH